MKILVIDDDPSLVQIVTSALTQKGHQVITAGNGQAGVDLARSEKPEFILLDQILPDIAGVEVLTLLKDDASTNSIPVVIFSAFHNEEAKEQTLKKGALAYLLKYEVESDKLAQRIEQLRSASTNPAS